MIGSMTAFARKQFQAEWGSLTWELRSVNHRYLEMNVRMPEFLRTSEKDVRALIQKNIPRGKVEALLSFAAGNALPYDFTINEPLVKKLQDAAARIKPYFPQTEVDLMSILNWNGVLQIKETKAQALAEAVLSTFTQALSELTAMRMREGKMLSEFIEERLQQLEHTIHQVKNRLPEVQKNQREKIRKQFAELKLTVDPDRFEQELVWIAQKADVAEELSRLQSHIKEARLALQADQSAGRRLDFLMQEFNREANTLGSKSADAAIAKIVVEMKVLIDQMREQVQNIE